MANAVFPVYRHLVELSADGKLFHIDDTRVRILSCYREDKDQSEKERRATHTSGIVVKDMAGRKIALYFSDRRHAGENLDDVLERRSPSLPMPIKMSDAAAVNGKKRAQTIDANCLAHGRGKFKELEEIFPVECGQVMEAIRKVYQYDDQAKGMSDQQTLRRSFSAPARTTTLRRPLASFSQPFNRREALSFQSGTGFSDHRTSYLSKLRTPNIIKIIISAIRIESGQAAAASRLDRVGAGVCKGGN